MDATEVDVNNPPSSGHPADTSLRASPDNEKTQAAQPSGSNIQDDAVDAREQGATSLLSAEQHKLLSFAEDLEQAAEASGYIPASLVERAENAFTAIVHGLRSFAELCSGNCAAHAEAFGFHVDEELGAIQSRTGILDDGHSTNDAPKDAREQAALSAPTSPGGESSAQSPPDSKGLKGEEERSEGETHPTSMDGSAERPPGLRPGSSGVTSPTKGEDDSSFHSVVDKLQDRGLSSTERLGESTSSSMPTRSSVAGKSSAKEDSEEPSAEERTTSPEVPKDGAVQRRNEVGAGEAKDAVIAVPPDDKAAGAEPPRQQDTATQSGDAHAELRSKCVGIARVVLVTAAALVCLGVIAGVYMSNVSTTTTTKEDTTLPPTVPGEKNESSYALADESEYEKDNVGALALDVAER